VGSLIHGGEGNFSYVGEGDLQFGKFGKGNILAWKYAQTLSYSFSHLKFRPVPSLLFGISSGDKNPANPDLQTFYPLFPKGLYYGFIDDSGSLNAIVLHGRLITTTVQLLGTYYEAGAFLRETSPPGRNTAYVSGKVIYRF
jgi:hypothetical protein